MNFIGVKTITKFILKHFAMKNYFTQGVFNSLNTRNYKQSSKAETHNHKTLYIIEHIFILLKSNMHHFQTFLYHDFIYYII